MVHGSCPMARGRIMGPSPKGAWGRLFYERDAPSPGHTQQEFQRTPFHSTPPRRMHAPTILNNKPTPDAFRQPADAAFACARARVQLFSSIFFRTAQLVKGLLKLWFRCAHQVRINASFDSTTFIQCGIYSKFM